MAFNQTLIQIRTAVASIAEYDLDSEEFSPVDPSSLTCARHPTEIIIIHLCPMRVSQPPSPRSVSKGMRSGNVSAFCTAITPRHPCINTPSWHCSYQRHLPSSSKRMALPSPAHLGHQLIYVDYSRDRHAAMDGWISFSDLRVVSEAEVSG